MYKYKSDLESECYTSDENTSVLSLRHRRQSVRTVNAPTTIVMPKRTRSNLHMGCVGCSFLSCGLRTRRMNTATVHEKQKMMITISKTWWQALSEKACRVSHTIDRRSCTLKKAPPETRHALETCATSALPRSAKNCFSAHAAREMRHCNQDGRKGRTFCSCGGN